MARVPPPVFMNALMTREDNSKLWSVEIDKKMFDRARQFWGWIRQSQYVYQLELLHGKISENGLMSRTEIEAHPGFPKVKLHYQRYYQSDLKNDRHAANVFSALPDQIDVVILDGGEFSSAAEYELLQRTKSLKAIVLDGTTILKASRAHQGLLADGDWSVVYDNQKKRHGSSIFVRNDELQYLDYSWGI